MQHLTVLYAMPMTVTAEQTAATDDRNICEALPTSLSTMYDIAADAEKYHNASTDKEMMHAISRPVRSNHAGLSFCASFILHCCVIATSLLDTTTALRPSKSFEQSCRTWLTSVCTDDS